MRTSRATCMRGWQNRRRAVRWRTWSLCAMYMSAKVPSCARNTKTLWTFWRLRRRPQLCHLCPASALAAQGFTCSAWAAQGSSVWARCAKIHGRKMVSSGSVFYLLLHFLPGAPVETPVSASWGAKQNAASGLRPVQDIQNRMLPSPLSFPALAAGVFISSIALGAHPAPLLSPSSPALRLRARRPPSGCYPPVVKPVGGSPPQAACMRLR